MLPDQNTEIPNISTFTTGSTDNRFKKHSRGAFKMKYHPLTEKIELHGMLDYEKYDLIICKWLKEKAEAIAKEHVFLKADYLSEDFLSDISGLLELTEEQTLEEKYDELILAVGNKFQDETRHETALRYIIQAENPSLERQDKERDTEAELTPMEMKQMTKEIFEIEKQLHKLKEERSKYE